MLKIAQGLTESDEINRKEKKCIYSLHIKNCLLRGLKININKFKK